MTLLEKSELVLCIVCVAGLWIAAPALPYRLNLGSLVSMAAALLLVQSLIRDLFLLAAARRAARAASVRQARCMCVESTVGVTGLALGAILAGLAISKPIAITRENWTVMATAVLAAGFLMKDFVFEWNPWRLRRDKDHVNIVVKWRR